MSLRAGAPPEEAERERLRELLRGEERERLVRTGLDASASEHAADAYAALLDGFAIAHAAEEHHDEHGSVEALDAVVGAIDALREDPRWTEVAVDRRTATICQAVRVLRERYETAGDEADLRRALALGEEAVALAREGAPALLKSALANLGEQLAATFDRDARREPIDRAVRVLREAHALETELPPDDHRSAAESLAAALLLRAKAFGERDDLDRAVQVLEPAIRERPGSAGAHDALGCVMIARAEQRGSTGDLDAAVAALERATELAPANPWYQADLAVALRARFTAHGDRDDARRSRELHEQALAGVADGAPDRWRLLQNAGAASAAEPSATDPVAQARAVAEATPHDARARPARLGALAGRLLDSFDRSLDLALLTEAMEVSEEALRLAGRGSVDRPSLLGGLAHALVLRYAIAGDEAALEQAIATAQSAVDAAPEAAAERGTFALTLAQAWSLQAGRSGAGDDVERASAAFRAATELGGLHDPGAGLRAGRAWGAWAAEEQRWPEAAEAFAVALGAAEDLYRRQVGRADREAWLRLAPGLPGDAAFACARAGSGERAVLALERGRARMLSDALDRDRAEVDALAADGRAALADRFRAAAATLGAVERGHDERGAQDRAAVAAARADLDAVVTEIRAVPGHEAFLAPAVFADVAQTASSASAAVVYVAPAAAGGVIAAVRADGSARVGVVDALDVATTQARVGAFVAAHRARAHDPRAWLDELTRTTDWLGDAIWPAVLETAGPCEHVVLVPAGLLGLLPLHAAARRDPAAPTGRRYALDDVLVTYAPNARALRASRRLAERVAGERVLTVGAPPHAGEDPLPYGDREAAMMYEAFGTGRHLPGAEATRSAVIDALAEHDVLHFACHGRADLFDPLAGALLLAGEDELEVRDVLRLQLPGARLAVLSACESAVTGVALPDEVIGLPTGLLQAGVAGVVGSLWQVPDASTLVLMRRFADEWRGGSLAPAEALRRAQCWVRDADNEERAAAYPDAPGLRARPTEPRLQEIWAHRRAWAHPHDWAAFAYIGA